MTVIVPNFDLQSFFVVKDQIDLPNFHHLANFFLYKEI